jgi:2-dehydropantoate 2-reductase
MPRIPTSKREWDGSDVRAYPTAKDAYKRTSKEEHPARELNDGIDSEHEAIPPECKEKPDICEAEVSTASPIDDEEQDIAKHPSTVNSSVQVNAPAEEGEPRQFSVCIIGAGGIGCHLAYILQKAGADVTLVARGENLRVLQTVGLHITICGEEVGPVHIPAVDVEAVESLGHFDYIFLTMKVSGYDSSIAKKIAPLIGPHTTILPPTTSIPHWWFHKFGGSFSGKRLERVDPDGSLWSALPPDQVIGFTMWLSAVQNGPGRTTLRHVQRGYPIGELDGSSSFRVERLAAAIEKGGVPAPRVSNIRSEIFIKSINSLAFNVVAVLGNAINGVIAEVPEAVDTLRKIMAECEVMATVMGIPILQCSEDRIKQTLSAHMHTMSMLHDLRSGKKLELRALWESICDLSEVIGVELPVTRALVGCALLREVAENKDKAPC